MIFNLKNWYWIVDGDESQVFSSASNNSVSILDSVYESWLSAGGLPTRISHNDLILIRIKLLEDSITERMKQEALADSDNTFASGTYAGKTSKEAIAIIVSQKDSLRAQLV